MNVEVSHLELIDEVRRIPCNERYTDHQNNRAAKDQ